VEIRGEDLSCYLNKIQSIGLRKCPYEHQLANKAYLSDITAANISESFTHKMAVKTSWHRHESKLHHCHPMYIERTSEALECWLFFQQLTSSCRSKTVQRRTPVTSVTDT